MARRYVFFRVPTNGKPYRGSDAKNAPHSLLAEIGMKSAVNKEGHICWPGFLMPKLQPALRAAVVVIGPDDRELNETDTWGIFWRAIVETVKRAPGQPVKPLELLAEADRSAAAYFRQPEVPYVLVSSLSVEALPANAIRVGGGVVSSLAERGTRFPLPDVLSLRDPRGVGAKHLNSSRYLPVKVSTKGRSIHAGTDNALNALNLLRGLWSLFATFGSWSMTAGATSRKPLGVIHSGPVHTLHTPDGQPVEDIYWYDPDFTDERPIFQGNGKWAKIEKNRRSAMRRLAAHEYRQEVYELLIRYAGALVQPNPDLAFLQMWSILEKITDTVGLNYDETIRRTVWLYSEESRPIAKDMLESLRYRRNQYVHSGKAANDGDQVAYLIKDFVDPHLLKLIVNPFKVCSLAEYGAFLALPADLAKLEEHRRKLVRAIRILNRTGTRAKSVREKSRQGARLLGPQTLSPQGLT
jgi:hypothetical protein